MLFDTHCHFDFAEFDAERDSIWAKCQQLGIEQLLIPGVEPMQWSQAAKVAQGYTGVFMSAGLHPWWVGQSQLPDNDFWQETLNHPACVAIGECGLDGVIQTPLDIQMSVFEKHLQMACDYSLPLIIHVRKTHNPTLQLLKQYRPPVGGVIHGFTGSVELAQQYWAMGFYLGIGGSITYPRANKTREAVQVMPLDALVLETDAPDMPLNGYQGQPNSPVRLLDVAHSLAQLRGNSLEQIAKATTANATQLFF